MNLFNRGGNPREAIGIGKLEALKIRLKELEERSEVDSMYTEKTVYIRGSNAFRGTLLNIMIDISKTSEPRRPDKFLIKYLNPVFFDGMDVEEQGVNLKSISENLEEVIKSKPCIFACRLYVKKEFEEKFPKVRYPDYN